MAFVVGIALTMGAAQAVPLPAPLWKMKFDNLEWFNPGAQPNLYNVDDTVDPIITTKVQNSVGLADGKEDNWGIARISQIFSGHGSATTEAWSLGDTNEEVRVVFGGLDITSWNASTYVSDGSISGNFKTGAANFLADGVTPVTPFLDVYLLDTTATDFQTWNDAWGSGPTDRIGAYGYDGISEYDGISNRPATLLASFQFVSGIAGPNHLTSGLVETTTNPPTGSGDRYLNVIPGSGPWADLILPYWPTLYGQRDAKLKFDFDSLPGSLIVEPEEIAGWHLSSDDPIEGAAVPEPATMLLLGSGLIGLAGIGRKRFFKKD